MQYKNLMEVSSDCEHHITLNVVKEVWHGTCNHSPTRIKLCSA